jgi:Ca2+-transporting ATPase
MAPTLMAGAIAGGQYYGQRDLSDPAQSDPSKSSAALFFGRMQVHTGTPHDNTAFQRLSQHGTDNQL